MCFSLNIYNIIVKNKDSYSHIVVIIYILWNPQWFLKLLSFHLTTIIKILSKLLSCLNDLCRYESLNSYFSFNKSVNCKMKLLTHNLFSLVPLYFVSNGNVEWNKWDQRTKRFTRFFGIAKMLFWASNKGDKITFRFNHITPSNFFPCNFCKRRS